MSKVKAKKAVTLDSLAVMVAGGFNHVNEKLDKVDERLDKVENKLDSIEGRVSTVEGRLESVEGGLKGVKTGMVTKDYLDEKLLALKGDLTIMMRKEDIKLKSLVEVLENKKILSKNEAGKILEMEPFPRS